MNFTDTSMHGVWLVGVEIDGVVERLVVNGVDVTAYVEANDPWQPLRGASRVRDVAAMIDACDALDSAWSEAIERVRSSPSEVAEASVDGEFSFVQTLRHLVFGMDKWFVHPVLAGPFHPIGLPNTGSIDFPWPDIDRAATASFDEAVEARGERVARLRSWLGSASDGDLDREVVVLENGAHPVGDCIRVVFEESFEHLRYARRDLTRLAGGTS